MVHASTTKNRLATWKLEDLHRFKSVYEEQIREMDRIRKSLGLEISDMQMRIEYPDLKNIFIARFNRDMNKAIKFRDVIETELKRRRQMIGATV